MSDQRYGEHRGRRAPWRSDWSRDEELNRNDDRAYGQSHPDRERDPGRDSRSFSDRPGGDPYGDYGQGSQRFIDDGEHRRGYGEDHRGTGGIRGRASGSAYEDAYGARPGSAYGRSGEGRSGASQDRFGHGGSDERRQEGLVPDNPILVNVAEGREATAGLHRGRGPKNYVRSDERIREDVSDRLSDDHHLDASAIEVHVNDGEVTLTGTIDHRHSKRRAEALVEDVSGVKHVQNNLRVADATSAATASSLAALTQSRSHN